MIDAMQVRGFSVRTHESYLAAVSELAKYYRRSPEVLNREDLQAFFVYLSKERGLSGASCRLYLNGIRFLYLKVLERPKFDVSLEVPKKAQRIPELLTRAEVGAILAASRNLKHRTLLVTCYGCGLRVSELCALKVRDIDGERHLLRIEQGKGAKDRMVILSDTLITRLRQYWCFSRPGVWLFPGPTLEGPLSVSSAQKIFTQAKRRAGICKVGGIHALRHAYATHQLEAGVAIHKLQRQLGHQDLRTTLRYIHWVPNYRERSNAVDLLAAVASCHD